MRLVPFVLILLIAFLGCVTSDSQIEEERIKTITVKPEGELKKTFSQFIDTMHFIPLETTSESLIGGISEIQFHRNRVYIKGHRADNSLYVFDTTGSFLFKISESGKGPGEFLNLSGFYINQDLEIVICDFSGKKILFYTEMGEFTDEIATSCYPSDVAGLGNDLYAISSYSPCHRITIIDRIGETVRSEIESHPEVAHVYSNELVPASNSVWFREYFVDTLYKVDFDRVIPEYFIDFQDKGMTLSEYLSIPISTSNGLASRIIPDGIRINCHNLVETRNFFSFYFWEIPKRENHYWCIYNIKKDEAFYVNVSSNFDDIFGTIDPPQIMASFNERLCFSVESYVVMEQANRSQNTRINADARFSPDILELSSRLSIDSNPVLVVFSLAKDLN